MGGKFIKINPPDKKGLKILFKCSKLEDKKRNKRKIFAVQKVFIPWPKGRLIGKPCGERGN
jgi:hypothetical protein